MSGMKATFKGSVEMANHSHKKIPEGLEMESQKYKSWEFAFLSVVTTNS